MTTPPSPQLLTSHFTQLQFYNYNTFLPPWELWTLIVQVNWLILEATSICVTTFRCWWMYKGSHHLAFQWQRLRTSLLQPVLTVVISQFLCSAALSSDCILSPHAICRSSRGYLTKWIQHGSLSPSEGGVEFYNKHGDVVIQLDLSQRNGLFYTTTTANATIIMLMFQMVTQRKVLEHMRKRYWTFLSIRLRPTSTSMHPAVTHAVNS